MRAHPVSQNASRMLGACLWAAVWRKPDAEVVVGLRGTDRELERSRHDGWGHCGALGCRC